MKTLTVVLIFLSIGPLFQPHSQAQTKSQLPSKKAVAAKKSSASTVKNVTPNESKATTTSKSVAKKLTESKNQNENSNIDKTPKAIFLIKRSKVDADIGEPVLYPFDRQISNLYYDLPNGVIRND